MSFIFSTLKTKWDNSLFYPLLYKLMLCIPSHSSPLFRINNVTWNFRLLLLFFTFCFARHFVSVFPIFKKKKRGEGGFRISQSICTLLGRNVSSVSVACEDNGVWGRLSHLGALRWEAVGAEGGGGGLGGEGKCRLLKQQTRRVFRCRRKGGGNLLSSIWFAVSQETMKARLPPPPPRGTTTMPRSLLPPPRHLPHDLLETATERRR